MPILNFINNGGLKKLLLTRRWPWHILFWIGYALFRFWIYYITVTYYAPVFLQYMLLAEIMLVAATYFTLWLYKKLFEKEKYPQYFLIGTAAWIAYLYARTEFQFYYLKDAPGFQTNSFFDIFINNITVVIVFFLFITSCKYFKDGYIRQQFEAARKEEQLLAEVNNLKSQIAPHFLFNTLNNLYGLAVEKSDKLPNLMLQLSNLLRHSLYQAQQPQVSISEEIKLLKSYMQLEKVRLEDDLKLEFENNIPDDSEYNIAPLILIVFMENAFKHSKSVQGEPVSIYIKTTLSNNYFSFVLKNNFNKEKKISDSGIGLMNVSRRLEVLYPGSQHKLSISRDERFYTIALEVLLSK